MNNHIEIEEFNKLSQSKYFYYMPTKDLIQLCKACDTQYLRITYPNSYKTVYVYVETIKFINNTSFIINGPLAIFINIDNDEIRFTYDLHGTITILFSDHPYIEALTKSYFMEQINRNSYINF